MAEAAILLTISKIACTLSGPAMALVKSFLEKEAKQLANLPDSMASIREDLQIIEGLLKDTNAANQNSNAFQQWILQVRQLAYHVEDVIDEYSYQASQLQGENYVTKFFKVTHYTDAFHKIAEKLKKNEARIKHLSEMGSSWVQMSSNLSDASHHGVERQSSKEYFPKVIKDEDLVGIEENRRILTGLVNSQGKECAIIVVCGLGGLGKTTLVTNVYEREKQNRQNFNCHAWVAVSQNCDISHLLRNLIQKLCKEANLPAPDIDITDLYGLKEAIREALRGRKYMIVLDDVWERSTFDKISDVFVDNQNGSRIIITTRKEEVASVATANCQLELHPLERAAAFDLFCRRAFQKNANRECPSELEDFATKIAERCRGLPLALVSIGSLLSSKIPTVWIWRQTYNELQVELQKNPEIAILNLSYTDLPGELKNSFLYCSLFPEDYNLSREFLVRLWIAEGFVQEQGESTAEEVAEGYLRELIHRNLLQLEDTDELGKVNTCKMHDIVRDLALSICKEEKFGFANQKKDGIATRDADIRRLSISEWSPEIASLMNFPHLRTLISFGTPAPPTPLLSSISSKSKYLTVLELAWSSLEEVPTDVGHLFNLRYLGLRGTRVKLLPRSIENLSNLQTMDLKMTEIVELPKEIGKLKKLRHLFADRFVDTTRARFRYFHGVVAPKGFSNLISLQTLETIEACKDLAEQLMHLTELRSLWIDNVKSALCPKLFASLSKMRFLSSLLINASDENEVLCFDNLELATMQLQRLIIRGSLAKGTLKSPIFRVNGINLKYLALSWCHLGDDPINALSSHLPNLTILSLNNVHCVEHLVLYAGCFPKLKSLALKSMKDVKRLEIQPTAVTSLEALYISNLQQLEDVPQGVEKVLSLKKLWLWGLNKDFWTHWQENGWPKKLIHIPELAF